MAPSWPPGSPRQGDDRRKGRNGGAGKRERAAALPPCDPGGTVGGFALWSQAARERPHAEHEPPLPHLAAPPVERAAHRDRASVPGARDGEAPGLPRRRHVRQYRDLLAGDRRSVVWGKSV